MVWVVAEGLVERRPRLLTLSRTQRALGAIEGIFGALFALKWAEMGELGCGVGGRLCRIWQGLDPRVFLTWNDCILHERRLRRSSWRFGHHRLTHRRR